MNCSHVSSHGYLPRLRVIQFVFVYNFDVLWMQKQGNWFKWWQKNHNLCQFIIISWWELTKIYRHRRWPDIRKYPSWSIFSSFFTGRNGSDFIYFLYFCCSLSSRVLSSKIIEMACEHEMIGVDYVTNMNVTQIMKAKHNLKYKFARTLNLFVSWVEDLKWQ